MSHRAAPERYDLKALTIHSNEQGQSIVVTEIADETGRTVFAQATAALGAAPEPETIRRMEEAARLLAGLLTSARPQHWLPGGRHVLTVHDGSEEPWGVTVLEADKWTLNVPDARTAQGHPDGAIEIAYPAANAPADGGVAGQAYAMTQSVYGQLLKQGLLRPLPIAEALRAHRLQMRAASAVIG